MTLYGYRSDQNLDEFGAGHLVLTAHVHAAPVTCMPVCSGPKLWLLPPREELRETRQMYARLDSHRTAGPTTSANYLATASHSCSQPLL